jgi:hypothetical protein
MQDNTHSSNNQKVFYKNDELLGGRYIIEEQLGCLTYKARNTTLGKYFILRFQHINENDDDFEISAQMLMKFKGHDNIANGIMKWRDKNENGEELSFVVQEYLEGAISLDAYLNQSKKLRSKRIKLVEVAIALSTIYEVLYNYNSMLAVEKPNILIHNEKIKITWFKRQVTQEYSSIHKLLDLISHALNDLKINTETKLFSREKVEINKDLKELGSINTIQDLPNLKNRLKVIVGKIDKLIDQNSFISFENYIEEFYDCLENKGYSHPDFKNLIDGLEKIKKQEERPMDNVPDELITVSIKSFEDFIDSLIQNQELNKVWPLTEERVFYATLLFKSVIKEDQFTKIYFGKYKKDVQYAFSNWDKDRDALAQKELLISNSCAGFPIVWYEEKHRREMEEEKSIKFKFNNENGLKFIEYVTVENVKNAIKSKTSIIANRYQKAGWNLTTKTGEDDGEVSDNISWMITIPIYKPSSINMEKESIIAVVHFELIQNLTSEELVEIAQCLLSTVHSKLTDIISLFDIIIQISEYGNYT